MNKITLRLAQFLNNNNAWILLLVIALIAFLKIMTFRDEFSTFVYLHESKWVLFSKFLFSLLLLFSPYLIYGLLRNKINTYFTKSLSISIWIIVFLLYPIFLGTTSISSGIVPIKTEAEVLTIFAIFLLIAEILSSPSINHTVTLPFDKWKNAVSPEWVVVAIFFYISIKSSFSLVDNNKVGASFFNVWVQNLIVLCVYFLFYYINHYFLVQRIYRLKGVIYYIFSFTGLVCIFYLPIIALYWYLPAFKSVLSYKLGMYWIGESSPSAFWSINILTPIALMILTIPMIIFVQWIKQSRKVNQLEKEKSVAELNLLKQQINPHFFFNTLNNIYSLSITNSDKTPEAITQLGDLMRYVIYEGQKSMVKLSDEVEYLENYLELQKMRLHKNVDIVFEQDIQNQDYMVNPLLFIILVENAFKHGIEKEEDDNGYLHLHITQDSGVINFICENSIPFSTNNTQKNNDGLGLKNLKRRLDLLYPERYTLTTKIQDDRYKVTLTMQN